MVRETGTNKQPLNLSKERRKLSLKVKKADINLTIESIQWVKYETEGTVGAM